MLTFMDIVDIAEEYGKQLNEKYLMKCFKQIQFLNYKLI